MKYDNLADKSIIARTKQALEQKGYKVFVLESGKQALEKIKGMIPKGASVMNGSSKTLEQIGYLEYLKSGQHGWKNLHQDVWAEKDPVKKKALRKQAILSDFYLGSVHALIENGEFIVASNTGSQLPHIVFSSDNLIFVIGTQKIVPTLDEGLKRLQEYVIPLEEQNMKNKFGVGTNLSKLVIFKMESSFSTRKINLILINEKLGF